MVYACKFTFSPHHRHSHPTSSPSFPCVLSVCNLHDVSWGTKGDNVPLDLAPVVGKTKEGESKQVVTTDLPVDQGDIDAAYEMFLRELSKKREKEGKGGDAKLKQEVRGKRKQNEVWVFVNWVLMVFGGTGLFQDVPDTGGTFLDCDELFVDFDVEDQCY